MRSFPRPVAIFLLVSIVLTILSGAVNFLSPRIYHFQFSQYPFSRVADPFRDFHLYKPRYAYFHSPKFFSFQGWPYMYPAPVAVAYRLFYYFKHSTRVFLTTVVSGFLIATGIFARSLMRRGQVPRIVVPYLGAALLCAYPFIIEFQQANMEFIIWVLMCCGLWAYFAGFEHVAAICFGIAAAMKIYPLIFLGLFLSRKQYRQIVTLVLTSALTTLVSLWLVCPDLPVSYRGIRDGLATFRELYILGNAYTVGLNTYDHSLFALMKLILLAGIDLIQHQVRSAPGPHTVATALAVYLPVCAIAGIILYFKVIRRLPIINQVICLTVATILLPPVSFDYTLMHLYAPWALLVFFAIEVRGRSAPGLTAAFVSLAVLTSSEAEYIVFGHTISGPLKAVVLIVLMGIALRYPFPSTFDGERSMPVLKATSSGSSRGDSQDPKQS